MKRKVSEIIKKNTDYIGYTNKFFIPNSLSLDRTKQEFINFIKEKEGFNYHYLVYLLQRIDNSFSLPSESGKDPIIYIENELKNIELISLLEILTYSNIRNKSISFFNISNLDKIKLNDLIYNIFFIDKNIRDITPNNLFFLHGVIDGDNGYLLLFNTKGKEIKYINKNLEFIKDEEPKYLSCYLSKNGFISISGLDNNKIQDSFLNFMENKLGIKINKQYELLPFLEIFESKNELVSLTRKGEVEKKGKNEFQNNSSRHSKNSNLKYKEFKGRPSKTGGEFNIDKIRGNINLGFSESNQLNLKKGTLIPEEYILVCEYFYNEVLSGGYDLPSFNELFAKKIGGNDTLIFMTDKDFYDIKDEKLLEINTKYSLTFDKYGLYSCALNSCGISQVISIENIKIDNIKCTGCENKLNYLDIQNGKLRFTNYFFNINDKCYNSLFDNKFKDIDNTNEKEAEYIYNFNGINKTIIIKYGLYDGKNAEIIREDDKVLLFLSPIYENKSASDFEIIGKVDNRNVYLNFNIEMFLTLRDGKKREELFKNICNGLFNIGGTYINKQVTNIALRDINGIQDGTTNSEQNIK